MLLIHGRSENSRTSPLRPGTTVFVTLHEIATADERLSRLWEEWNTEQKRRNLHIIYKFIYTGLVLGTEHQFISLPFHRKCSETALGKEGGGGAKEGTFRNGHCFLVENTIHRQEAVICNVHGLI